MFIRKNKRSLLHIIEMMVMIQAIRTLDVFPLLYFWYKLLTCNVFT